MPITITFPPVAATPGTPATATVTQGPLVVTAFPIVGTEGIAIPAGPIATFIDAGGVDPALAYSATITVTNAAGVVEFTGPAASITQNGNAAQFTVNAPAFTLPEEGTYQVLVAVTDSGGATPITVDGASFAVIADAPLTDFPIGPFTGNTGVKLSNVEVGSFTDANLGATASDFTGTIDWGDGSPNSLAAFGGPPTGQFFATGSHTYAKPGVYTVTTDVKDVGGSEVTLISTYTITDLPVTGAVKSFTAVEVRNTGTIVLATFEDPNTLATASSVTATLPIGGWGDTTPGAPVTLAVQQIGLDPATGDPIFEVLGSHTYTEEGTYTVNISVTTSGGVTTPLTAGTATVIDAKLTGSSGTEITGVEGTSTGTVLLGTFVDANQGATVADYSAIISWGDGTAPYLSPPAPSPRSALLTGWNGSSAPPTPTPKKAPTPTRSRSPMTAAPPPSSPARRSSPTRRSPPVRRPADGQHRRRPAQHHGRRQLHRRQSPGDNKRLHGYDRLGRRLAEFGRDHHPARRCRHAFRRDRWPHLRHTRRLRHLDRRQRRRRLHDHPRRHGRNRDGHRHRPAGDRLRQQLHRS